VGHVMRQIVENWSSILLLTAALCLWAAGAEAAAPASICECVAELRMPAFSSLARSTSPSVTVDVQLQLDSAGRIQSTLFQGGDEGHHADINIALSQSKFVPACFGKALTMRFTFEIAGEPREYSTVLVTFRGPNHFVLQTHPLLPHIHRTRSPQGNP